MIRGMGAGIQVIGAGLPRTGTRSLKLALERLLGAQCYHMSVVFERDFVDVPAWQAALDGQAVDWAGVFAGCVAAVDWPASVFWRELADLYPDALVVLSTRQDPQTWWRSADRTVWSVMRRRQHVDLPGEWFAMSDGLTERVFGEAWDDPAAAMSAYEGWNADVRASCPPGRLLEWDARAGWEPLCERLGVPVPPDSFPHTNTTEEWLARASAAEAP